MVCGCREGEKIDAGTETNSNLYHELYYHFLGTDQSEDVLCWRDQDNPKHMFGSKVTDDGKVTSLLVMLHFKFSYDAESLSFGFEFRSNHYVLFFSNAVLDHGN